MKLPNQSSETAEVRKKAFVTLMERIEKVREEVKYLKPEDAIAINSYLDDYKELAEEAKKLPASKQLKEVYKIASQLLHTRYTLAIMRFGLDSPEANKIFEAMDRAKEQEREDEWFEQNGS